MPKKELDARIEARVRSIKREKAAQDAASKKNPKLKGIRNMSMSDLD